MPKYYAVGSRVKVMTTSFIGSFPEKEIELNEQQIKDSLRPKKNPNLVLKMFENLEQAKRYASAKSQTNLSAADIYTHFTPVVEVTVAENAEPTPANERVWYDMRSQSLDFNYLLIHADKIEKAHSYFYKAGYNAGKDTTVAREFSFREIEQKSSCTIM